MAAQCTVAQAGSALGARRAAPARRGRLVVVAGVKEASAGPPGPNAPPWLLPQAPNHVRARSLGLPQARTPGLMACRRPTMRIPAERAATLRQPPPLAPAAAARHVDRPPALSRCCCCPRLLQVFMPALSSTMTSGA